MFELARLKGYPRVRLRPGVYVAQGAEMWRRFVAWASEEELRTAEAGLVMLKKAEDSGRTRP